MIWYLYLIPTAILVVFFLMYTVFGRGFRDYKTRLETKVRTIEKLSNIVFTKDMLSMFLHNSSVNTSMYFSEREIAEELGEEHKTDDMPLMSMKDMTRLESSLKNALQPSRDLERVVHDSILIRRLMIISGILIAATEYIVVSADLLSFTQGVVLQLDGIVFGIALILSVILLLILIDMFTATRKINTAYDNVGFSYKRSTEAATTTE